MKGSVTILKSIWGRFITTAFPLFFLVLLSTCITPVDVEPSDFEDFLVVQGFITDDFGPHDIRITRVTQFSGVQEGGAFSIEDVDVSITDEDGVITPLKRVTMERKGLVPPVPPSLPCQSVVFFTEFKTDYRTPETFRGEIGSTYTLEIRTKNDRIYRSLPQKINPTPPIDSIFLEYKELPSLDPIVPRSGVEVFTSWQDPQDEENYYFWRINGIYRIFTPDRSTGSFCCTYDPRDGGAEDCWIDERNINANELAFSDQMVNGQSITFSAGFVEDDGLRFANEHVPPQKQYYLEVEQFLISELAFLFNEKIKILSEINDEIFDPPPVSVRGNIFNINDSEEIVLGYFGAYAKQTKGIFVPRSLLNSIQRFPDACGDCRTRAGAQIEIPKPYRN